MKYCEGIPFHFRCRMYYCCYHILLRVLVVYSFSFSAWIFSISSRSFLKYVFSATCLLSLGMLFSLKTSADVFIVLVCPSLKPLNILVALRRWEHVCGSSNKLTQNSRRSCLSCFFSVCTCHVCIRLFSICLLLLQSIVNASDLVQLCSNLVLNLRSYYE